MRIDYADEDEIKALEAYKSYVTQYTPDEMAKDHRDKVNDSNNFLFFRRFVITRGIKMEFDFR